MWLKVSSLIHFAIFMFFVGYIYFFKTACPYFLWNWLKSSNVHELGERESQVLTQSQMNWSKASLLTRPYRFLSHRVTHWSRMSKKTSHKCISKVCTIHKRSSHQNRNLCGRKTKSIRSMRARRRKKPSNAVLPKIMLYSPTSLSHVIFLLDSSPLWSATRTTQILSAPLSGSQNSMWKRHPTSQPSLWFSTLCLPSRSVSLIHIR